MAAILSGLYRNYLLLRPAAVPKQDDALKIGILGAANIAPKALITPAKSHPEVIVYSVAARDKAKATAFAKKHGIPHVKDNYQELIDDPAIDAVYNPLPNGLHFEWTAKALAKGKHVLLEKPSVSNKEEAEILFRGPLVSQPNAPVLMEAFHNRFTPAFHLFVSLCDHPNIAHVVAKALIPSFVAKDDDIRFNYDLAGGTLMDVGGYPLAAVRCAMGADPTQCLEADLTRMPPPLDKTDAKFHVKYQFPNGAVGEVIGSLREPNTSLSFPTITVVHHPELVKDFKDGEDSDLKITKQRTIHFVNFILPPHYHRIEIDDEITEEKLSTKSVKVLHKKETKKAYTFKELGVDQPSEAHWSTYRCMLEQFVNQVKGRPVRGFSAPSSPHEDSIAQVMALDMAYEKSGLGLRPTSEYRP